MGISIDFHNVRRALQELGLVSPDAAPARQEAAPPPAPSTKERLVWGLPMEKLVSDLSAHGIPPDRNAVVSVNRSLPLRENYAGCYIKVRLDPDSPEATRIYAEDHPTLTVKALATVLSRYRPSGPTPVEGPIPTEEESRRNYLRQARNPAFGPVRYPADKADLKGLEAALQPYFRDSVKACATTGALALTLRYLPSLHVCVIYDEELKGMTMSQMIDRLVEACQNADRGDLVDLPKPAGPTWRGMTEADLNAHFRHLATGLTVSLKASPYRMEFRIPAPHPAWTDFRWYFDEHDLLDQPLTLVGIEKELEDSISCWADAGNRAERKRYDDDEDEPSTGVEAAREAMEAARQKLDDLQVARAAHHLKARKALQDAAQHLEAIESPEAAEALMYCDAALRVLEGPRPAHQQAWTGGGA